MTGSLLVISLVDRLKEAGYTPLPTPFKVASVEFEFTAAMKGTAGRALDLILIVDTATGAHGDRDAAQVRQRVEALSRALDITGSRFVLTVILAGASLQGDVEALFATCRVLTIEHAALGGDGRPTDAAAKEGLDDHIRILLPLNVRTEEATDALHGDPIAQLVAELPETIDKELVHALAMASLSGQDAVTRALATRLDDVLSENRNP